MLGVVIIAITLSTAVFCGGLLLLTIYNRQNAEVAERVQELRRETLPDKSALAIGGTIAKGTIARDPSAPANAKSHWLTNENDERQKTHARLVQAGIYNPSALFFLSLAKITLVVAPLSIGLLVGWLGLINVRFGILWGAIASALGMLLPSLWLDGKIRRRHCMFRRTIADFLDLMIVCLEGGLSLQGTMQRVTDELQIAHPELAVELTTVQRDVALGATIDVALRRFADRTGFEGIRMLATCVRESQRYGTQLADALRVHADMLRGQRENAAEEQAQKAAVKILIPMLLLILPAIFVVLAGPAAIQIQQAFSH